MEVKKEEVKKIDAIEAPPAIKKKKRRIIPTGAGREKFAAILIQVAFRVHLAFFYYLKMAVKAKHLRKKRKGFITTRGSFISNRYCICKMYFVMQRLVLQIKICDIGSMKHQTIEINNFHYSQMSYYEFSESIERIYETIKYDMANCCYCLSYETKAEVEKRVLNAASRQNSIQEDKIEIAKGNQNQKDTVIYAGERKYRKLTYSIKIKITPYQTIEVMLLIMGGDYKEQTIAINYNFRTYLSIKKEPNKNEELGKFIYNMSSYKEGKGLIVNQAKIRQIAMETIQVKRFEKLKQIQSRFRVSLSTINCKELKLNTMKPSFVWNQFGIRIGKQYHFIKILRNKDGNNSFTIKSNKAPNQLQVAYSKLIPHEMLDEPLDSYNVKQIVQIRLPKIIAYDLTRKRIILFIRKNKTPTPSDKK